MPLLGAILSAIGAGVGAVVGARVASGTGAGVPPTSATVGFEDNDGDTDGAPDTEGFEDSDGDTDGTALGAADGVLDGVADGASVACVCDTRVMWRRKIASIWYVFMVVAICLRVDVRIL